MAFKIIKKQNKLKCYIVYLLFSNFSICFPDQVYIAGLKNLEALDKSRKIENEERRNNIENNIIDAYNFIETLVDKSNKKITLDDIKKIHWHIYKGIDDSIAGKFRDFNYTGNSSEENRGIEKVRLQDYKNIPKKMGKFIDWLNKTDDDIVKIAGDVLIKLFDIHPFVDGNGRVARAVMNLILIQNDYPPAIIDCAHNTPGREEYLKSLTEFRSNRPENYYAYISKCIEKGIAQEEENHLKANIDNVYSYAEKLIDQQIKDVNVGDILEMHKLLLTGINDLQAGKIRKINVKVSGSKFNLPDYKKVPQLLKKFMTWFQNLDDNSVKTDPEKMAFDVLINFLKIHPFVDGNFRIARLLMNIVLIQKNYSPVLINCDRNSKEVLEFANIIEQLLIDDNRDIGYLYIKSALVKSRKSEEEEKKNKIENNIIDAYNFIETLIDKSNKKITLDDIKKIHWHIYKGINDSIAGKFRDFNYTGNPSEENAGIEKLRHQDYKNIPKKMDEFIDWLNKTDDDIVKIAGDVLIKLFEIHPFVDGNGRVARAVMNLILIQNDYPPAVIDCAHNTAGREEYINALREIQINNRPENYYAYISKCIEKGIAQEEEMKMI